MPIKVNAPPPFERVGVSGFILPKGETMTDREIRLLVETGKHAGYNPEIKREFKRLARKFLRELKDRTGLDGDLRWNEGGIAVSGEATFHTDGIYVQISGELLRDLGIMYRTCKGRKDYSGGANRWFPCHLTLLHGVQGLAFQIAETISVEKACRAD
jgi:hypothetical protein